MDRTAPPGGKVLVLDGGKQIVIDPEFRDLLDPLEPKELGQLEANLIRDGRVIKPLAVWQEEGILLDGHHRVEIAIARNLNYQIVRINLPDREAALQWVLNHQEGQRNLSDKAKEKIKEWRRDRVVKLKEQEQLSTRSIAEKEGVSEKTVRRDLKARGVDPDITPTKGKDKKKYKSRAERLGIVPPTPFTPKGERMAGDDTKSENAAKKAARSNPKAGKPLFDWQPFNRDFAALMLAVAKLGKAYKAHNSPQCKALAKGLTDWKKELMTWYKALTNQKAPMEPHERGRKGKK